MSENDKVSLTIDGKQITVDRGTTLMEAAAEMEVSTPIICYHERTTPKGLCRQCVVEVEGWRTLPPACITEVSDGMEVTTDSERVLRARKTILEMLNASVDLSHAPEIQEQMKTYGADPERFPGAKKRDFDLLDDNPFYVRDYSQCVMCWRCVQACADDIQYTYALAVGGRGHDSHIATFFDAPMPDTTCVFCGHCVAVCPTNALQDKTEYLLDKGLQFHEIRARRREERQREKRKE